MHVTGRWFTEPRTGELLPFPYRMRRYLMTAEQTINRHTLGQIRHAARLLGDDSLFGRVVQGCEHAVETVGRFLVGDVEHAAQGTESAQRHSALAV